MAQFVAQALGALPVVADVGEQALGALVVQLDAREVGSLKVAVHDRDVLGIPEVARQQSAAGVAPAAQIGRASCRDRVCQYAYVTAVSVSLQKTYICT